MAPNWQGGTILPQCTVRAVRHTAVQFKIKYALPLGSNPKDWLSLAWSVFLLKLLLPKRILLPQIGNGLPSLPLCVQSILVQNIHFKLTLWIVRSFPNSLSVLWPLLTSHSSLLLRLMEPPVRPHGINQYSFLVYLPDLRIKVTATFWTSLLWVNLSD